MFVRMSLADNDARDGSREDAYKSKKMQFWAIGMSGFGDSDSGRETDSGDGAGGRWGRGLE